MKVITISQPEPPTDEGELGESAKGKTTMIKGVNSYPTQTPPDSIVLGNGWGRQGDIITLISSAGGGKSTGVFQASIAWGLGMPYFGIHPARPLRILHFSGEDDGVTIGECREGFLEHSEELTGRTLTKDDLKPLDEMLRTEFSREHVGARFHGHLDRLLTESPADLVIINPLLSYVGGEIVACASEWLRGGLMPILQKHDCMALIAHHTGKMAKDGWDNTDDTYSAIGGGEMANIPRSILTLRPTAAEGLFVVKVSKRQTTGWTDGEGNFTTSYFVKRSGDPTRPAWLPLDHDEAIDLVGGSAKTKSRKITPEDVTEEIRKGDTQRKALIEILCHRHKCSDKPCRDAIDEAVSIGLVATYTEPNPRGGKPLRWFKLNE